MLKVNDNDLKLRVANGLLHIKGQTKEFIVQEQSMHCYELFYRSYVLAFLPCENLAEFDFMDLWIWNPESRELLCEALRSIGIDTPEDLTPRQLQALLITYDDKPGLIFQLHNTYPKLMGALEMIRKTGQSTVSNPPNSAFLKLRNFFLSVKTWLIFGFISLYPGL